MAADFWATTLETRVAMWSLMFRSSRNSLSNAGESSESFAFIAAGA